MPRLRIRSTTRARACVRTCSAGTGANRQRGTSHGTPRICTMPDWTCAAQLVGTPSPSRPWLTRFTHPRDGRPIVSRGDKRRTVQTKHAVRESLFSSAVSCERVQERGCSPTDACLHYGGRLDDFRSMVGGSSENGEDNCWYSRLMNVCTAGEKCTHTLDSHTQIYTSMSVRSPCGRTEHLVNTYIPVTTCVRASTGSMG